MKTVELISIDGHQAVRLPDEFRFSDTTVTIRKEGDALILERVKAKTWPTDFSDAIHIDDTEFIRPSQGATPALRSAPRQTGSGPRWICCSEH